MISEPDWYKRHLDSLSQAYKGAAFCDDVLNLLTPIADEMDTASVSRSNEVLIKNVANILSLQTDFMSASVAAVEATGQERVITLAQQVGGTRYLSGMGARSYQSDEIFSKAGLALEYHDMSSWLDDSPLQSAAVDLGKLSIVDTMMYLGAQGVRELLMDYESHPLSRIKV